MLVKYSNISFWGKPEIDSTELDPRSLLALGLPCLQRSCFTVGCFIMFLNSSLQVRINFYSNQNAIRIFLNSLKQKLIDISKPLILL